MPENASKRIPLTPDTYEALRDFKNGLGTDYDRAIQKLFELALDPKRDKFEAGKSLRNMQKENV